ncbi:hypothetical protein SJ05684_b59500 (plasmid) [Sinorhizobium sojae CCBAU 05684]|uniref:Uncharacterized protein n=1 Tax=Sinorhizobium sojae CCBAU 05684 TaxID=716928 RepID=A0A249PMI5_9HYPH|nr:hypothetical protein SJ05684_b59500 [Sinorhizobium sojae CCBAU 05684]
MGMTASIGLFLVAFGAATVPPFHSEPLSVSPQRRSQRGRHGIESNSHDARRRSCEIVHPVIAMSAMAMEEMH